MPRRSNSIRFLRSYKKWYPLAIQSLLGGLFSAYVVFYFQSASLTKTAVFFALLMALLVVNEFLEKRYANIYLQVSLFFLVNFSFFIFFIPIVFKSIGIISYLSGSLISLATVGALIAFLKKQSVFTGRKEFKITAGIPPVLSGILFMFYVLNWIPPVPLSLKYGGIYHKVEKSSSGNRTRYTLTYEKPPWYRPFKQSDDPFRFADGDRVYCFSSVFASTYLKTSIFHRWQRYSPGEERWLISDRIPIDISGGRDEGYRIYTYKDTIEPGDWRVDVVTENDRIIGRIGFSVVRPGDDDIRFVSIIR